MTSEAEAWRVTKSGPGKTDVKGTGARARDTRVERRAKTVEMRALRNCVRTSSPARGTIEGHDWCRLL